MSNGSRVALTIHCGRRPIMVYLIVPCPVPLDWPALKDIKACCPEEPQDDIDQIGPPGDPQPFLIDQEDAAVEEE